MFIHPPPDQTQTKQQMGATQWVCLTHIINKNKKYLSSGNTFLLQRVYAFITLFVVALRGGIEGEINSD